MDANWLIDTLAYLYQWSMNADKLAVLQPI